MDTQLYYKLDRYRYHHSLSRLLQVRVREADADVALGGNKDTAPGRESAHCLMSVYSNF